MKIGIIGHLKFPIAKPYAGGLEAFTHAYTNALKNRGHIVCFGRLGSAVASAKHHPKRNHP